eukprot:NODE_2026_length_696_cov_236.879444_g1713_i0.p2 GENE.NODE_2026_length_696_cov_236.879444_g1713_i0~~NODE_2026_length_696_cov_236.879444_g1713_i0.p2  ORF type:complete len:69 (-),score=14.41 NODE_2026_length_696_cov_236.879444_g1713_i0:92-298(-)
MLAVATCAPGIEIIATSAAACDGIKSLRASGSRFHATGISDPLCNPQYSTALCAMCPQKKKKKKKKKS